MKDYKVIVSRNGTGEPVIHKKCCQAVCWWTSIMIILAMIIYFVIMGIGIAKCGTGLHPTDKPIGIKLKNLPAHTRGYIHDDLND